MQYFLRGFRDGWSQSRVSERMIVAAGMVGAVVAAIGLVLAQLS